MPVAVLEEETNQPRTSEYEEVIVNPLYLEQKVKVGWSLLTKGVEQVKEFLIQHKDNFAWSTLDMPRINSDVVEHKLNVDPMIVPVQQKPRRFKDEKEITIKEELAKLL